MPKNTVMGQKNKLNIIISLSLILLLIGCSNEAELLAEQKKEAKILNDLRQAQIQYEESQIIIKEGIVKRGQGLFQALKQISIEGKLALNLINTLRDKVEFSKLKVGDTVKASFYPNGKLNQFEFSNNPAEKHVVAKNIAGKFDYKFIEEETIWRTRLLTGELASGSTLQNTLWNQGVSKYIAGEVINILLCKVNFRFDARMGDKFKILLKERLYKNKTLETRILYTSYSGKRTGKHEAYFYDDGDQKSTFTAHYTSEGEALIRSGLRYPVRRLHIRSSYGMRRHPVTGKRAMHRGVDFRGRVGTPVHAVAHGRVIESKYTKIGGNKIAIKHADNSISYYLHLHKRFVKKGDRVKSYQRIGQVGKTGRVTGPHLHFGFKNSKGRWMNPMHKRMIATPKLKGKRYAKLKGQIEDIKIILRNNEEQRISQSRALATQNNI